MKKENFYAPYYDEEFFRFLNAADEESDSMANWYKVPSEEGTNHVKVAHYTPRSNLVLPRTELKKDDLAYDIIDGHNHLDSYAPRALRQVMEEGGVGSIMNLSGHRKSGELLEEKSRLEEVLGDRLLTAAPLPWNEISRDGAEKLCDLLKRYRERGVAALKVYKKLGLTLRDEWGDGSLLELDDRRFDPVWELCGKLGMPVFIHQGDPEAFFHPIDENNERLEELGAHPDWSWFDPRGDLPGRAELLEKLERVIARHEKTRFISVHVGNNPEDLGEVARALEEYPNLWVDISARVAELGRQPNRARKFFLNYQDRILFGTDLPPHPEMYRRYRRFLETDDDNFRYPTHVSGQGNWRISGIYLPEEVLRKVYRENFLEVIPSQ